jgi:protein-S-isoprenylcysteine O-methyltransferase Ste14
MNEELFFRIIFLVYYLTVFVVAGYYRRTAVKQGTKRDATAETKAREGGSRLKVRRLAGVVMIGGALLYVLYPPFMAWLSLPIPTAVRWFGIGMAVVSLPLLAWVLQALGKQWSRNLQLQDDHELITDGPYKRVRHPMYTIIFLTMSSLAFISANLLIIIPAVVAMGAIYSRIDKEEAMLKEAFPGQYEQYMNRTGKLLPKLGQ